MFIIIAHIRLQKKIKGIDQIRVKFIGIRLRIKGIK